MAMKKNFLRISGQNDRIYRIYKKNFSAFCATEIITLNATTNKLKFAADERE